jgi:hypothetical protein
LAGRAVEPLMPVSAQETARNKPRLRKEAEFTDNGLNMRIFGPECPDKSIPVNRFGVQTGSLADFMHQYRA